jgi:hypothetical protein
LWCRSESVARHLIPVDHLLASCELQDGDSASSSMPRAGRVARARAAPNRGSVLAFISKMIDSELRLGARVESDCQCTVTLAGVQVSLPVDGGPGPPAGAGPGAKARRVRRPDAGAGGHRDNGPGQATASFKLVVSTDSDRRRCQRRHSVAGSLAA